MLINKTNYIAKSKFGPLTACMMPGLIHCRASLTIPCHNQSGDLVEKDFCIGTWVQYNLSRGTMNIEQTNIRVRKWGINRLQPNYADPIYRVFKYQIQNTKKQSQLKL